MSKTDTKSDPKLSNNLGNKPDNKHTHAYDRMMERVKAFVDEAEGEFGPKIQYGIDAAKEKASELGELTAVEAEKVGDYVKKDIHDAAEYMASESQELKDWLRFDVELVEDRLIDIIGSVINTTKMELQQLAERAAKENLWNSGEVTGPGTLTCTNCGHPQIFYITHEIKVCPECEGNLFQRRE